MTKRTLWLLICTVVLFMAAFEAGVWLSQLGPKPPKKPSAIIPLTSLRYRNNHAD